MNLPQRARRDAEGSESSVFPGAFCVLCGKKNWASVDCCDNIRRFAERVSIYLNLIAAMNNETENRDPERLSAALRIVVRRYCSQIRRHPALAIPALLLPGIGQILIFYTPPLIIASVLGKFASNARPSLRELIPYVVAFTGV